jgi:SAM-dependent methyltransferase
MIDMAVTKPQFVSEAEEFWNNFTASAQMHPANLYRYELIGKLIQNFHLPSDSIIDLGCGNGALLSHFKSCNIGNRFIGVDGSLSIIKKNREQWKFGEFYQADLQKTANFPFKDTVDLVVCSEVIEHMLNDRPLFKIAYNQLKPGGYFILTTQGGKRRCHDIELLGHLRHYDIDVLSKEVTSFGFQLKHQQQVGWPILNLQKIAASLFMKQVARELASSEEPTFFFKMACKIVEIGLKFSSKRRGPQLLIVAQKPYN